MARATGPTGRVIAMEPHPDIGKRLQDNVNLNHYEQVEVIQAALSDQDGSASFYSYAEEAFHQGISSLLPDEEATREIQVPTLCGSSLIETLKLNRCDVMGIDVEGFEVTALNQLDPLIAQYTPVIIFEFRKQHWDKFGEKISTVFDRFNERGYLLYTIRKNVAKPMEEPIPASCEVLCVPPTRQHEFPN